MGAKRPPYAGRDVVIRNTKYIRSSHGFEFRKPYQRYGHGQKLTEVEIQDLGAYARLLGFLNEFQLRVMNLLL